MTNKVQEDANSSLFQYISSEVMELYLIQCGFYLDSLLLRFITFFITTASVGVARSNRARIFELAGGAGLRHVRFKSVDNPIARIVTFFEINMPTLEQVVFDASAKEIAVLLKILQSSSEMRAQSKNFISESVNRRSEAISRTPFERKVSVLLRSAIASWSRSFKRIREMTQHHNVQI